eukprot:762893-Hanusia_phi.AAC.4
MTTGDRHLNNSLVLEDGRILGIDFGHAFGSATFLLPNPELVPFRMTPQVGGGRGGVDLTTSQLMGLLHPVDAKGSMKHTMARVLRTLRDSRRTLLHVLSMFVKDPVLTRGDPRKGIKLVEEKLDGKSPFGILKQDIARNSGKSKDSALSLIDHVRGDKEAWEGDKLNVFEQVDALLHIATSRDILARSAPLQLVTGALEPHPLMQQLSQSFRTMVSVRLGARPRLLHDACMWRGPSSTEITLIVPYMP